MISNELNSVSFILKATVLHFLSPVWTYLEDRETENDHEETQDSKSGSLELFSVNIGGRGISADQWAWPEAFISNHEK